MKITKRQLKQIIKEEISKALSEEERKAGGGLGGPGEGPRYPTPEEKCQAIRREWEKAIPELYGGQGGDYDWEGEERELTDWMKGYPECFKDELAKLDPETGYFPENDNPIIDFLASASTNKGPMTHAQRMGAHQRKIQDS